MLCIVMLSIVMLNVVLLNAVVLNVVMLNVVMLSVFMLIVPKGGQAKNDDTEKHSSLLQLHVGDRKKVLFGKKRKKMAKNRRKINLAANLASGIVEPSLYNFYEYIYPIFHKLDQTVLGQQNKTHTLMKWSRIQKGVSKFVQNFKLGPFMTILAVFLMIQYCPRQIIGIRNEPTQVGNL